MSFEETWRNASSSDFKPPRGNYTIKIISGSAWYSNDGDPLGKLVVEILEGDLSGRKFEHFMWMGNDGSMARHKEALLAYGLDDSGVGSVEDLDDAIAAQLPGVKAEVGVSYGGDEGQYMNVNVHRSWPPDPQSELTPDNGGFTERQTVPDDGDLPF